MIENYVRVYFLSWQVQLSLQRNVTDREVKMHFTFAERVKGVGTGGGGGGGLHVRFKDVCVFDGWGGKVEGDV